MRRTGVDAILALRTERLIHHRGHRRRGFLLLIGEIPFHLQFRQIGQARNRPQAIAHSLAKRRRLLQVRLIRTPRGHWHLAPAKRVLANERRRGHRHESQFLAKIFQLQQRVVVITIAVHHHRHDRSAIRPEHTQPPDRRVGYPPPINRHRDDRQLIIDMLLHIRRVVSQVRLRHGSRAHSLRYRVSDLRRGMCRREINQMYIIINHNPLFI